MTAAVSAWINKLGETPVLFGFYFSQGTRFVLPLSIHTAISKKKKKEQIFLFTVLNESTFMLIIEHMHLQEV